MNRPEIASCALIALLIATSPLLAQPAADDPLLADDLQLLRDAHVRTDGPGLLTFFREHTVRPEQRLKAAALIPQLGSDRFAARERASHLLTRLGQAAREPLGLALTDSDAEVRRRARVCLADIQDGERVSPATAAARVLASRPAAGAAAVLLDYLPYAPDESVESDVVAALLGICRDPAFRDMALSRALSDPEPIRRAAAALTLGCWGDDAERAAVRKALADPHPKVRLLAAEALLVHAEPAALDALIEMLAAAPFDHAAQAEDLLLTVAGSTAPKISLEASPPVRARCAAAWRLWRRDSSVAVKALEIDSLLMPPARRALAISRQFFQALSDGKAAAARSLAAVPFCLDDGGKKVIFNTAKELSEFIVEMNEGLRREGFRWAPFGPAENSLVFARRMPRGPAASNSGIDPKLDVWICPFRISTGKRNREAQVGLYIRMRGAKGVVIGLSAEER